MNIKDISKLINSLVPEIKAQVAEKMKFIGAENATFNLTVKVLGLLLAQLWPQWLLLLMIKLQ